MLAKDCSFANDEEMIRDRIVFGTNSKAVREKLLSEGAGLNLQKAVEVARNFEYAKLQMKEMSGLNKQSQDIHAVKHKPRPKPASSQGAPRQVSSRQHDTPRHETPRQETPRQESRRQTPHYPGKPSYTYGCSCCGRQHGKDDCPAKGRRCAKCGGWNHFAIKCGTKNKKVHSVDCKEDTTPSDFYIDSVDSKGNSRDEVFVDILTGPRCTPVRFKIDSGAKVNVLPKHIFNQLNIQIPLEAADSILSQYTGSQLHVLGMCTLPCTYQNIRQHLKFYVVNTPGHATPPLLGLRSSLDLKLIKIVSAISSELTKESMMSQYCDVFQGLGSLPGECELRLEADATPVVHPPRKVPHALRERLKEELDKMESAEVIAKVTEPTDWVNSIVVVEKPNGSLRICLDPQDLNRVLKRPHYPMRTLDEVTSRLKGAKYFSIFDARSGYWSIKLTEESSVLTTFNTPFGRYRFKRLPFGVKSAQDEFQRRIDEVYEGINGVDSIVDDIIVYGETKQEHDKNVHSMLQRSREKGVRLNPDKVTFCVQEVGYFGHVLSEDGMKPDPKKVKAIVEMEPPKDKGELQTILGMVNYLSKYAPNLSEITAPMRCLLKQDAEFVWDSPQDVAFNKMKEVLSNTPVLAYYDPTKPITLQVDASKFGLGATLLQSGRPVAYASKSLTPAEVNYAQIEKEMYAILFGCQRFHQYIYGHQVTVESDHKPIESIMKKPVGIAPPRLQRILLQLQKYDLHVCHRPGKEIPVADALSRHYSKEPDTTVNHMMEAQVHMLFTSLPVSDERLKSVRRETQSDEQMQCLHKVIIDGWPQTRQECPERIQEFWNHRDELTVMNDIIFKGEKIVIPSALRSEMLQKIHIGHMGMEKCKLRAKDVLFWPGMNKAIESMVAKCGICQEGMMANPKEPMIPHPVPSVPWEVVGTDLFELDGHKYVIVVDYYSRYFEVEKLQTTSTTAVVHKLKGIFARHGIPRKVVSDNGPQYSSAEFARFATDWDFKHVTSSPNYPQSNGLSEKFVQTAKRLITKSVRDRKDPYISLLEYRNTPLAENGKSPAQMLMSRQLRSILPCTESQLIPKVVDPQEVKKYKQMSQQRQKWYHDRGAHPLKPLQEGDFVRIDKYCDRNWKPAVVERACEQERSYVVRTEDGAQYRRNRRHLRHTHEDREVQNHVPESPVTRDNVQDTAPEPVAVQQDMPCEQSDQNSPVKPQGYMTRSGRCVKPRQIMDM